MDEKKRKDKEQRDHNPETPAPPRAFAVVQLIACLGQLLRLGLNGCMQIQRGARTPQCPAGRLYSFPRRILPFSALQAVSDDQDEMN